MPILELPSIADDDEINDFLMLVSENVKRIRTQKGVSQFDLALTIGQKGSGLRNRGQVLGITLLATD